MITSTMELISKESKAGTAFSVLSLTRLIEKAAILKERDEDICYHSLTPPYIEGQLPGTDTQDGSCLLSGLFFDWAAKATTTATGNGNENRKKSERFRLAKQQLCACITLFCTFLCPHSTTETWKDLISRLVDDVNTRKLLSFSFTELRYSLLEFNSSKICQHLTNWTRWNNRDKVWSSASSV